MRARGLQHGSKSAAIYGRQGIMLQSGKRSPHQCKRVVGSIPSYQTLCCSGAIDVIGVVTVEEA